MTNIKYYFRSLLKHKLTTLISIIGISLGFASCIIIGLHVKSELSFDNFHANKKHIYRLLSPTEKGNFSASVTYRLGNDCVENIDGVKAFARLYNLNGPNSIAYNKEIYKADKLFYTDPGIMNIFSFDFIEGSRESALDAPGKVILTKNIAENLFGKSAAYGKTIILDNNETLTVSGVVKSFPLNSHFDFNYLVCLPSVIENWGNWVHKAWSFSNFTTYLVFDENYTEEKFYDDFERFAQTAVDDENRASVQKTKLQKLSDIHLHSKQIEDDFETKGSFESILILISLAICILLIGTINYASLNISNVSKRVKEVVIRKISGANRRNIVANYITESVILSISSIVLAYLFIKIIYSSLIGYLDLNFDISELTNLSVIAVSIGIALLIAFLSGIYIAKNTLKHNSVELLRGKQFSKVVGFSKSHVFLSVQFSISIVLIISSIFIFKQLNHVQTKHLGYEMDKVISVPIVKSIETRNVLKETLLKNPQIKGVTIASSFPPNGHHNSNVSEVGNNETKKMGVKNFFVGENFNQFLDIKITVGRDFHYGSKLDEKESAIVNESFVREMGWKKAIGKHIKNSWDNKELQIIGVVKDFHFKSLHEKVEPVLITLSLEKNLYYMGVKFNGDITEANLNLVSSVWKHTNPSTLFEYQVLGDVVNHHYSKNKKQARAILLFSLLAIIITCMGLIATAVFLAQHRTKEIGIRKVNGAKVFEILIMLNRDFIKWVAIAFVIACPVAYYTMNKWLENFAYKTSLSWWIFAVAGVLAMGIAFLTVSWQSWRAATRNPVEALRYE